MHTDNLSDVNHYRKLRAFVLTYTGGREILTFPDMLASIKRTCTRRKMHHKKKNYRNGKCADVNYISYGWKRAWLFHVTQQLKSS